MNRRTPLPKPFTGAAFRVRDARMAGLGRKRLDHRALSRPFAGVRSTFGATSVTELCQGYLPKMADAEFFSHTTAAVLHGIWLPLALEQRMLLHVSVRRPARAPRDRRVQGHHLVDRPYLVRRRRGLRVSNALETWCQLATVLHEDDLVVAGDSLVAKGRPGAASMLQHLLAASADDGRPCSRRLRRAALRVRRGSRSPWETRLRLLIVSAGLPEPEVNALVDDGTGGSCEVDLVYRAQRVLIEYEGDQHRTDRKQWRRDVVKYERLTDLGWRVIRVSADDLVERAAETIARIRRALARRA